VRRRFATFELDLASGELYERGRKVPLQDQPFKILARLTRDPGAVVSRDELRHELWPDDTFVGFEHGLNEAVKRLRRALNDSADHPRFIETLPKRGYRFIARVDAEAPPSPPSSSSTPAPSVADTDPDLTADPTPGALDRSAPVLDPSSATASSADGRPRRSLVWLAAAALTLAAISAVVWRRGAADNTSPDVRSIAVLPFSNLSNDRSLDYIADGFTEELTATLASVNGLRVKSRTSVQRFKDTTVSARDVAASLDVDALIEGSIRVADGRLRITAQLVRGATDEHLWASTYERPLEDVLAVQRDISTSIARELRMELRAGPAPYAPGMDALAANLKGRYQLNRRTPDSFASAAEFFRQAIAIDPVYAAPRAGLAETFALMGIYNLAEPADVMPKARAAAHEALAIDPTLASPHVVLAWTSFMHEWNWANADAEFQEALRLDQSFATAHQSYGVFLAAMARPPEAERALTRALDVDPLSLSAADSLAWFWYTRGELAKAEAQYGKLLELDPSFGQAHRFLGLVRIQAGDLAGARASLEQAQRLLGGSAEPEVDLVMAQALTGDTAKADAALERLLLMRSEGRYVSAALLAGLYESLGRREDALGELERAERERATTLVLVGIDPLFARLRGEPRFQALAARVGLPPNAR
jgi:TolB-like protein/DNA-binding winged helix-turn-helix (wHTH) protein/Flp pilus assembly protein TadD